MPNGTPRKDWAQVMDRVRTFYNDIAAWALDDPGTWAMWWRRTRSRAPS
jgi:hypothetical protein